MKKSALLLPILLLCLLALKPIKAHATHAAGGEIIYEWLSDSTYRFFFKFYRDCTGAPAGGPYDLCFKNSCPNIAPPPNASTTIWTGKLPGNGNNGDPVTAGCAQTYPDKCTNINSPVPGFQEWWYSAIVTLPGKCNFWTISASVPNRNGSTANITPLAAIYIETTFNNKFFEGNSSPYFSIKPVPYVCVNTPFTFNNGAIDPNGDSLATDIVQPQVGDCNGHTPTTFTSPAFNLLNNPFPTNNSFSVNSKSGQMSFTAAATGSYGLTIRVREFRKGILIGYIMRDVNVQVLQCSAKAPIKNPPIVQPGLLSKNDTVFGCIGSPMTFCFDVKAQTIGDGTIFVVDDNHWASLPAATTTYTRNASDSVRACVSYWPKNHTLDIGYKGFLVTIKDSTCLPPGIMLFYTLPINMYVWPQVVAEKDTSICPGGRAYLTARNGGDYKWNALPGGAGNGSLNATDIQSPQAKPGVTTKYAVESTINTFCPDINKDTVTVTVYPAPLFTPLKDVTTCPHNPVALDLKPTPPPGAKYKFKWFDDTRFLNSDTLGEPVSNPFSDVTYKVKISTDESICVYYDTVVVDVLDGFVIQTNDTDICEGQAVQANVTGDARYSYQWSTNAPAATYNFSNDQISNPIINQSIIGKFSYKLVAGYYVVDPITNVSTKVCTDSIASFNINVQPNPTVVLDADTKMCFGDTMKLVGHVKPADYPYDISWSPASSLDDATIKGPIFKANAIGDVTLTMTASSSAKCAASDDIKITIFPADFLTVSNDTSICPGDSVQMHMTANGVKSYYWYPDVNISSTKGFDPNVWPAATQKYTLYAIDTNLCSDTEVVKVTVKPGATLNLPDSVKLYPGESYRMEPGGNCSYFNWFPPVGLSRSDIANPVAKPDVNTHYVVNGRTETGCTVTSEVDVIVEPDSKIEMPNAFVPGSGPNGLLKPVRLGDATLKTFSIYNRWGAKLFETADVNEGWDGTFKQEPQPLGVYIYVIEAVTHSGRIFSKQGNITLIR